MLSSPLYQQSLSGKADGSKIFKPQVRKFLLEKSFFNHWSKLILNKTLLFTHASTFGTQRGQGGPSKQKINVGRPANDIVMINFLRALMFFAYNTFDLGLEKIATSFYNIISSPCNLMF